MPWPYDTLPPQEAAAHAQPWLIQPSAGRDGGPCLQAGPITHTQTASAQLIVPAAGDLRLWYKVSSEPGYDFLRVLINGTEQVKAAGLVDWQLLTVPVTAGAVIVLRYTKDGSVSKNLDTAWVHLEPLTTNLQASLNLLARGALRTGVRLGKITLSLGLALGTGPILPPQGLGAQVDEQALLLWLHSPATALRITVGIDDAPPSATDYTVISDGRPSVIRASTPLPDDGVLHVLHLSAWYDYNGRTSARVTSTLIVKPLRLTVPPPFRVNAHRLRQAAGDIDDLIEITWIADSPVKLLAAYNGEISVLDFAASQPGENRARLEGLRRLLPATGSVNPPPQPVYVGVRAVRTGRQSPPLFSATPLLLVPPPLSAPPPPKTPDELAGTAQKFSYSSLKTDVAGAVQSALGLRFTTEQRTACDRAVDATFQRIKRIVMTGGAVTVADVGTYAATWKPARVHTDPVTGATRTLPAYRTPSFRLSRGFSTGTAAGRIMTDAEAES